jgi:endonuclease YncB( thermonuclease family)
LYNLIRAVPVTCEISGTDTDVVDGSCNADGRDVARVLTAAGWIRPADPGVYSEELIIAKQDRKGLWNGDWAIEGDRAKAALAGR